jgi:predicted acyl esterase
VRFSAPVYDSEILNEDLQVIGIPKLNVTVKADAPLYQWFVRLEDVNQGDEVSLISGALIRLTQ